MGVPQHLRDVDRLVVGLGDRLAVEAPQPVERGAALHGHVRRRHVGDLDRVVLAGEDRLGEVAADLLRVDVECGDERDVADVVPAEVDVHQPGNPGRRVRVPVVLHALHERRGTVADAGDGHPDLVRAHGRFAGHCSPGFLGVGSSVGFRCGSARVRLVGRPLLLDQLVEPPHLALAGVEAELVQLAGVAVDLLARAGQHGPQALPPLLHRPPTALEDAHPDLGGRAGEEREVHAEAVVVERLRPRVGQQLGEALLALGGDPVHAPGAAGPRAVRRRGVLDDQSGPREAAQRGVQGSVGDDPQAAEPGAELLAQLVAVHRGLVEQAQDRQLEHGDPPHGSLDRLIIISSRYIRARLSGCRHPPGRRTRGRSERTQGPPRVP